MLTLQRMCRHTAQLLGSQRKLWLPFLLGAFVEALYLGLLWLAPQSPFSAVLAPPVRYVFGDRVLHYPEHLLFLYHAMKHTHLVTSILTGAFLTGIACAMVRQTHEGVKLSLRTALVSRQVRYGRVLLVWLVTWALVKSLAEGLAHVAPKTVSVFWWGIGSAVLLQALLVYAIPAAVFEDATWWKALLRSVQETAQHPLSTLAAIVIPCAMVIGLAIGAPDARVKYLMLQVTPEIAVAFIVGRLVVWTVADALLTVSVAHLWWIRRTPHRALEPGKVSPPAHRLSLRPRALTGFAALLCAAMLTPGCSASYNGERLFWKAQQLNAPIMKDSRRTSPEQFTKAVAAFGRVIRETPGTAWAGKAQLAIGLLYDVQGRFNEAEEAYRLVLQNYSQSPALCFEARVSIAHLDEAEQNWPRAVQMYREISDFHPWTKIGLEAPLSVARTFEQRQQPDEAAKAYRQAVQLYTTMIAEAPTVELGTRAKIYLAQVYQALGKWDQVIGTLEELATARDGVDRPRLLLTLGTIYETRQANPAKAAAAYTTLLTEFPEHPLGQIAKSRLRQLGLPVATDSQGTSARQAGLMIPTPTHPAAPAQTP